MFLADSDVPAQTGAAPDRWWRIIGATGALFALAILGASMLLRLAAFFGRDGLAISTLPVSVEDTARVIHRIAASLVGLLAVIIVVVGWKRRPLRASVVGPVAWVLVTTVFLALIGPLTPGYRHTAVTVGNVIGGMVLLMAFWWLREVASADRRLRLQAEPLFLATWPVFLLHVATGAAASANAMHAAHGFAYLHLGTALLSTMFIGAALWSLRAQAAMRGYVLMGTALLVSQTALGFLQLWLGARPLGLTLLHGLLSPLLAMVLVSLATREMREYAHRL